jgi:hypothetical protein
MTSDRSSQGLNDRRISRYQSRTSGLASGCGVGQKLRRGHIRSTTANGLGRHWSRRPTPLWSIADWRPQSAISSVRFSSRIKPELADQPMSSSQPLSCRAVIRSRPSPTGARCANKHLHPRRYRPSHRRTCWIRVLREGTLFGLLASRSTGDCIAREVDGGLHHRNPPEIPPADIRAAVESTELTLRAGLCLRTARLVNRAGLMYRETTTGRKGSTALTAREPPSSSRGDPTYRKVGGENVVGPRRRLCCACFVAEAHGPCPSALAGTRAAMKAPLGPLDRLTIRGCTKFRVPYRCVSTPGAIGHPVVACAPIWQTG